MLFFLLFFEGHGAYSLGWVFIYQN
jgi:hypothetical protein